MSTDSARDVVMMMVAISASTASIAASATSSCFSWGGECRPIILLICDTHTRSTIAIRVDHFFERLYL